MKNKTTKEWLKELPKELMKGVEINPNFANCEMGSLPEAVYFGLVANGDKTSADTYFWYGFMTTLDWAVYNIDK